MASLLPTFSGSCHCGALGFAFQTAVPVAQWSVRACQCGFCRAHGVLTTSDPAGRLTFHVHEAGALRRYRFGLKTADFLLCRRCGVYVGARIKSARGAFGIINVRALSPAPDGLAGAVPPDYSAESTSDRLKRREERWTPVADAPPRSVRAVPDRARARRRARKPQRARR